MSATATNVNLMGMPVEEVVPDAAMVRGVSRSSLLTGRRRVRLQPQTGTSASAGSIVQFVLADSSSLLDLNSVTVNCVLQVNAGTGDTTLDDGPAWIRRTTIALNGTNIDDTDLANRFANANVYGGADRNWYNAAGSFAGYWAQNPSLAVPVAAATYTGYTVGDVSGAMIAASARYKLSTATGQGMQLSYPLSLVSRFFATKQYLPLSQCGELVIQLLCASHGEALFQRPGYTNGTYALTSIFLEADFVQPHYLYQEMLNRVTQLEGEQGMVIPFNAVISAQGQSITSSGRRTSLHLLRRITCGALLSRSHRRIISAASTSLRYLALVTMVSRVSSGASARSISRHKSAITLAPSSGCHRVRGTTGSRSTSRTARLITICSPRQRLTTVSRPRARRTTPRSRVARSRRRRQARLARISTTGEIAA